MALFHMKFFVSLAYCLPSFVIYTLLIVMMLRNWKEFNSAFFRIVIADYCFNLLTYLNSMITLRLPNGTCKDCLMSETFGQTFDKEYSKTANFLVVFYFFHFGNAYFQYSMVTLMSLNRATAIFFFFANEKIWKYLFPFTIGLMILVSVYSTRTILYSSPYYTYNEALDMYSIKADTDILPAYWNVIRYMMFAVVSSISLNCVSVVKLKIMQQKLSSMEKNLLFATITSSIVQSVAAGNTFLLQMDMTRTSLLGQIAQVMLPFSSDALTIGQPFILIFLSSKVRMGMMHMYMGKTSPNEPFFTRSRVAHSTSRSSQIRH